MGKFSEWLSKIPGFRKKKENRGYTISDYDEADKQLRTESTAVDYFSKEETALILEKIDSVPNLQRFRPYFEKMTKRGLIDFFDVIPLKELSKAEIMIVRNTPYLINPEPLNSGGMGTVYKAFDPALQRAVAIKVLGERFSAHPDFLDNFSREAKVHANEDHPNIVTVYQFSAEAQSTASSLNDVAVIVMEYLNPAESRTLNQINNVEPEFIAQTLVPQICDALEHFNTPKRRRNYFQGTEGEFSLLHADLKPGNILLKDDGTVKITDFGIASHAYDPQAGAGTTTFLSPERAAGLPFDVRSELFSLTTIIYYLMTKKRYFNARFEEKLNRRNAGIQDSTILTNYSQVAKDRNFVKAEIQNQPFEGRPELVEYCREHDLDETEVAKFFITAWAKDPDQRYQTPEQYLRALQFAFRKKRKRRD